MEINNIINSFYEEQITNLYLKFNSQFNKIANCMKADQAAKLWETCFKYKKQPLIFSKDGINHYVLGYRLSKQNTFLVYSNNSFNYIDDLYCYQNSQLIYSPNKLCLSSYIHLANREIKKSYM